MATQTLDQTQPQAQSRKQWMQLFCFFCVNEKMVYTKQKRYIDPETGHGVVESHAKCEKCGYKITTKVPYEKAFEVVDPECLPTEEALRNGAY